MEPITSAHRRSILPPPRRGRVFGNYFPGTVRRARYVRDVRARLLSRTRAFRRASADRFINEFIPSTSSGQRARPLFIPPFPPGADKPVGRSLAKETREFLDGIASQPRDDVAWRRSNKRARGRDDVALRSSHISIAITRGSTG